MFKIKYNIYKYQIKLFNLINISIIYQILINNILDHYLHIYVIVYLDNVLIYSDYLKNHKKYNKNLNKAS